MDCLANGLRLLCFFTWANCFGEGKNGQSAISYLVCVHFSSRIFGQVTTLEKILLFRKVLEKQLWPKKTCSLPFMLFHVFPCAYREQRQELSCLNKLTNNPSPRTNFDKTHLLAHIYFSSKMKEQQNFLINCKCISQTARFLNEYSTGNVSICHLACTCYL